MATRILIGLITLAAIVQGLAAESVGDFLPVVLVILGLLYGGLAVDAEDATAYLVVTLAVGGAAGTGVLSNIPAVGDALNAILGGVSVALFSGAVTILCMRAINRVK
ncbi:MAG: hypothetical protein OXG13_12130 [Gemmatimonadaceae bacterium]|nr:hypothetical protein [Gemmatimonadaceae bacterium]